MSKRFALIGAAGYVAPRHMKAIKETGNVMVASHDPYDGVGIMDTYFPMADFFTEFERFDRHLDKLKRNGQGVDFVSICSPNYLHDSHIRFGLRQHAHVICEKPLVLNPWNVEALNQYEEEYGKRIYTILQLRLHPSVLDLKSRFQNYSGGKVDVDLTYITSRGHWYFTSWKGDQKKSGGVATNIGIHFFDMLIWIFGRPQKNVVHLSTHDRAAGYLELENARVRWFLSINSENLPLEARQKGLTTYRSLKTSGEEFEFSGGFEDLHTRSYQEILKGNGYNLMDSLPSIQLVHEIRNSVPVSLDGNHHPFAELPLSKHPFSSKNKDY